ncbi:MAG: flagellar basal body-associated FliL family protein [Rhodobacteraceae bacterium]|jgi:flagellar FliL protein|uniref:flagellar basal body-associated FliL family protein n=1 Tax=Albidovulum sp. TaxID=1872424 RepID=UPI001DCBDAFD|nr:flagellar basal body-associated FliL family protein [uncultured Defluviimonas sp.]MCB2124430.1 flagellar basal body-associated FliL family protein [Paracoccaceae bacterium]MCC0070583.1 flagellar basal body-associated FliL family protein [Paracoccaceae bacterium]
MSHADAEATVTPKKRSKVPLIVGLFLMLALGGGGFYAVYAGLVFGQPGEHTSEDAPQVAALPDIAFVPIDPLVVSLGSEPAGRYLHFTAQLEVAKAFQPDVTLLLPRVIDVLNSYLRAVEVADLEDPTALVRLRAQMLRRVQMVAGDGRVRDLLVTGFVIN